MSLAVSVPLSLTASKTGARSLARALVSSVGFSLALGCAHTEKVAPPPDSALAAVSVDESGVPFAPAPEGLLRPGGVSVLQKELAQKGFLDGNERSGRLDPPTREALRAFQARHDLPETGLPSYASTKALGVDPRAVFFDARRPPPSSPAPSHDQGSVGGPTALEAESAPRP